MFVFRIKEIREKKKMTIYKLSKLSNVSRSYIIDLENNRKLNPSLTKLYSLATALNVNIKDLFYTKFDIDILKQEMYKRIDKYGIKSQETLEVSQLIDLLINIDNKKKSKGELTD